jgi:hypothetical protein
MVHLANKRLQTTKSPSSLNLGDPKCNVCTSARQTVSLTYVKLYPLQCLNLNQKLHTQLSHHHSVHMAVVMWQPLVELYHSQTQAQKLTTQMNLVVCVVESVLL